MFNKTGYLMNSRTLLFILIVTLSVLGVRSWYEKQYQDRLIEWQKQYGIQEGSAPSPLLANSIKDSDLEDQAPLALFDLPLVYTNVYTNEETQSESLGLVSTQLIEEISQGAKYKKAFGAQVRKGMYVLLSDDVILSWPEKLPLFSLKTQAEINTTNAPYTLLKAFNPGFAVYIDPTFSSKEEKAYAAAIDLPGHQEYAVLTVNKNWSDPESYSIVQGKMTEKGFITNDGKTLSQDAIVFQKGAETLPAGIISVYEREKGPTTYALGLTPFFQTYFKVAPPSATTSSLKGHDATHEAKYYVLENKYQQIVFSTKDAAIVEINLPFASESNTTSVVRPISYDERMTQISPKNAQFPLQSDAVNSKGLKVSPQLGGYYPLLRRALMSDVSDTVIAQVKPQYEACILLPKYQEGSANKQANSLLYSVKKITENSIEFETVDRSGQRITKRFSFPENIDSYPYCIDVTVSTSGNSQQPEMMLTTGVPEIEWMSGTSGASIGYCHGKTFEKRLERVDLPKERFFSNTVAADWVLNSNGFFGLILKPLQEKNGSSILFEKAAGSDAPSRLVELDESRGTFTEESLPGYQAAINTASNGASHFRLFAGPLDETILSRIDEASERELKASFDFNKALTFQGWFTFISEPFARLLYFFMKQFHSFVGSWGLSIIFATVILRILLYPLNTWSIRSMKRMQEISPLVKAIQERHKKDPSKAQMELMALYRDKGVNPFSGCLPLLIQMPFLIGMFDLLKSTFQLRGASFIPGWITDLSSPDTLFQFPISLPFIGNEFHLLPILLGTIMWIQQAMSSNLPKDPNEWTEQQRQQRATGLIMTVVMTIMFYNFPSGLNVYWISSMVLGIIQQWWTVDRPLKSGSSR